MLSGRADAPVCLALMAQLTFPDRQQDVLGKPSRNRPKWGAYAEKLAALKVGKSFEIADYPHSQTEISKLRGGIGGNRAAHLIRFAVRRLSGTAGIRITKLGVWDIGNMGG